MFILNFCQETYARHTLHLVCCDQVYMRMCVRVCTHVCIFEYIHMCYLCMHVCAYVYAYVCALICIRMRTLAPSLSLSSLSLPSHTLTLSVPHSIHQARKSPQKAHKSARGWEFPVSNRTKKTKNPKGKSNAKIPRKKH